jgi:hypothetical protein
MLGREFQISEGEAQLGGIHIALVVANADPLCLERVRVRVLGVHDMENTSKDNSIWAVHVAPSKTGSGEIPDIDDYIYVTFLDHSDPHSCAWIGWCRVVH